MLKKGRLHGFVRFSFELLRPPNRPCKPQTLNPQTQNPKP